MKQRMIEFAQTHELLHLLLAKYCTVRQCTMYSTLLCTTQYQLVTAGTTKSKALLLVVPGYSYMYKYGELH